MNKQIECDSQRVASFLNDSLSDAEQTEFETHLDQCDRCCRQLDELTAAPRDWHDVASTLSSATDIFAGRPAAGTRSDINLDFLGPTEDPEMLGRFAGYEIAGVVGIGGMGIVLKGFDRALNRFVAIKVLLPHYASSAAARQRFAREGRAAAAVVHENVIAIHGVSVDHPDAGSDNSRSLPYLVMPYLRGESLQKRLDRCGSLPVAEILRIAIQIAEGLAAAHEQGLVHRDIKPANILLPDDVERVTITDFGLARAADDAGLTRTGVIAGTPQYMSPEQAEGRPVTFHSDLFSLGSLIYVMCTGRIPFRAESPVATLRRIIDEEPRPIRELNPDIPEWLCKIVEQLLAKASSQRPDSAAAVAKTLKECLAHMQQPVSKPWPRLHTKQTFAEQVSEFFLQSKGWIMIPAVILLASVWYFWPGPPPAEIRPDQAASSETAPNETASSAIAPSALVLNESAGLLTPEGELKKTFRIAFDDPDVQGTLDVDIKRGTIQIVGQDRDDLEIKLTVPDYQDFLSADSRGTKTIRSAPLDFEIEGQGNHIEVDSNSDRFVTNLEIMVPRNTELILDTYRNGKIEVHDISGAINARSQNCSISLVDVSDAVKARTYNGNLKVVVAGPATQPIEIESYNGNITLGLPTDVNRSVEYRSGKGSVKTDFDIQLLPDREVGGAGENKIQFDELNSGTIGEGGELIRLETENGDIAFGKWTAAARANDKLFSAEPLVGAMDSSGSGFDNAENALGVYENIRQFVAKDQMPKYLEHAAKAGWLEAKRELAISELKIEEAYRLEAELVLVYEKTIRAYQIMADDPSWQRRFPDMDLRDIKPYESRLEYYKKELAKRARNSRGTAK